MLSPEQQADAERATAQAKLDPRLDLSKAATPAPAKSGKGKWFAAGGAVLALFAAGGWFAMDAGQPMTVVAAPAPLKGVITPAAPVAAATVAASASAPDSDVSAAAILDATPTAAPKVESLKDMLSAPAPAKPKTAHDELSSLLETTPGAKRSSKASAKASAAAASAAASATKATPSAAESKAAAKLAAQEKKNAKLAQLQKEKAEKAERKLAAAGPTKKSEAPPKAVAAKAAPANTVSAPDNDVALLAALAAQSNGRGGASSRDAPPRTLKQCKQLGAGQAESCIARLCANSAKSDAECKGKGSKAGADS